MGARFKIVALDPTITGRMRMSRNPRSPHIVACCRSCRRNLSLNTKKSGSRLLVVVFFFFHRKKIEGLATSTGPPPPLPTHLLLAHSTTRRNSRRILIMQRPGVLLVLAPLLGMCAASTPSPSATWPANVKKGCLLLNKRHNFTELTGSCDDSQVCTPGDNADPQACSQCKDYDSAVKVSLNDEAERGRHLLLLVYHQKT